MERILRNVLKVLLVMVISVSALNLGLVSALEEEVEGLEVVEGLEEGSIVEEEIVNYDDSVMGVTVNANGFQYWLNVVDKDTGIMLGVFDIGTMMGTSQTITYSKLNSALPGCTISAIDSIGRRSYVTSTGEFSSMGTNTSYGGLVSDGIYYPPTSALSVVAQDSVIYLYVTSNIADKIKSAIAYDVSLRTVTGGSLASTSSSAVAGSTVTVTATPNTGYSLTSATVSGATNVNVSRKFNYVYDAESGCRSSTGMEC